MWRKRLWDPQNSPNRCLSTPPTILILTFYTSRTNSWMYIYDELFTTFDDYSINQKRYVWSHKYTIQVGGGADAGAPDLRTEWILSVGRNVSWLKTYEIFWKRNSSLKRCFQKFLKFLLGVCRFSKVSHVYQGWRTGERALYQWCNVFLTYTSIRYTCRKFEKQKSMLLKFWPTNDFCDTKYIYGFAKLFCHISMFSSKPNW